MGIFKRLFWRRRGTGWKPNPEDGRDLKYRTMRASLPAVVSLRIWATVVDQKSTNSCVGNAVAGAVFITEKKSGFFYGYPSRMFIYWLARRRYDNPPLKDDGAYIRGAFKQLQKFGVPDEKTWPFRVSKINKKPAGYAPWAFADPRKGGEYMSISGSGEKRIQRIKSALKDGYPVVFGTELAKSFLKADGSIIIDRPKSSDKLVGGHALVIVGYRERPGGSTQFEVLNSWGRRWRDGGYCWFTQDYITWKRTGDFTIVRGWKRLGGGV
jgi:hypothetical protein